VEDHHQKLKLLFVYLQPAKATLAVFKLPGEVVQVDPSYSSVAPVLVEYYHQKLKLLFEFHNLLKHILLYLNFH
jgi:excinuclease UvrABC helicase subunit UvrB